MYTVSLCAVLRDRLLYRMFLSLRFVNVLTIYEILSLGTPESSAQTASRSVQPFLHSSRQSVATLYNVRPFSPKITPSDGGSGTPSNMIPWTHPSPQPELYLDRFSCFRMADYCDTDRQTDHATPSVTIRRIYTSYRNTAWHVNLLTSDDNFA